MNREIEFRGKHIHILKENEKLNGTWVYGYLCDDNYIYSKKLGGDMLVDKNTIGQYTGLKDKNGKKIFEGDIVKINNINYRVLYSEYRLSFVFLRLKEATCYFSLDEIFEDYYKENQFALLDIEVIGNIYENDLESKGE